MCGISGEIRFDGEFAATDVVARMTAAMAPRGPDGSGVVSRGPVAFGHRRLQDHRSVPTARSSRWWTPTWD